VQSLSGPLPQGGQRLKVGKLKESIEAHPGAELAIRGTNTPHNLTLALEWLLHPDPLEAQMHRLPGGQLARDDQPEAGLGNIEQAHRYVCAHPECVEPAAHSRGSFGAAADGSAPIGRRSRFVHDTIPLPKDSSRHVAKQSREQSPCPITFSC